MPAVNPSQILCELDTLLIRVCGAGQEIWHSEIDSTRRADGRSRGIRRLKFKITTILKMQVTDQIRTKDRVPSSDYGLIVHTVRTVHRTVDRRRRSGLDAVGRIPSQDVY